MAYVITIDWPRAADDRRHPIDHDLLRGKAAARPVAEPVLARSVEDFGDVSGSRKQLSLF